MGEVEKVPGVRKRLTLEEREQLRKLWEEGLTVGEISLEMNKHRNTIYGNLKLGFVKDKLLPNGRYTYDPQKVGIPLFGTPRQRNPRKK